jgi:hypothetical protein
MSQSFNAAVFGQCLLEYSLLVPPACKKALQDVALDIADGARKAISRATSRAPTRGRSSSKPWNRPAPSPSDWMMKNGFEYKWFGSHVTWLDAENICQKNAGHLASIHSEEEDQFMRKSVIPQGQLWVFFGMSDADEEGSWVWSDGSPVNFQPNFVDGKDNIGGRRANKREGDCSAWNNADKRFPIGIHDTNCLHKMTFVCKRQSGSSSAVSTARVSDPTQPQESSSLSPLVTVTVVIAVGVATFAVALAGYKGYQRLYGDSAALAHHELTLRNAQTAGQIAAPERV